MITFQFAQGGSQWKRIYSVNPMLDNESIQQPVERRAGSVLARNASPTRRENRVCRCLVMV
jgi:hypothetical protein